MSGFEPGLEVAREIIPARIRRGVYAGASLGGYGLTSATVGVVAWTAGAGILGTALAVLGSLIGPLGQLAASNTAPAKSPAHLAGPVFLPIGDDPVEADA